MPMIIFKKFLKLSLVNFISVLSMDHLFAWCFALSTLLSALQLTAFSDSSMEMFTVTPLGL